MAPKTTWPSWVRVVTLLLKSKLGQRLDSFVKYTKIWLLFSKHWIISCWFKGILFYYYYYLVTWYIRVTESIIVKFSNFSYENIRANWFYYHIKLVVEPSSSDLAIIHALVQTNILNVWHIDRPERTYRD